MSEIEGLEGGLGDLFRQAQEMQANVLAAQQRAAEQVVEGVAGGGLVRVEVTGTMEFRSVRIDPKVVDPSEVELLEDLILAALHDGAAKATALNQQAMGALNLGGLDLGGLLGT